MCDSNTKKRAILRAPSSRSAIKSFIAMDVLARANEKERAGEPIIHMEVGQPSTPAPPAILEAARASVLSDRLGYTEALGIGPLRRKIADYYRDTYGVSVDAERVVVTTGSSAGFILAFLATLENDGRVALGSPGYPCYRHILKSLGNEPVIIETNAASRWAPRVEDLRQAHAQHPLQAILLASPANPTGTMVTEERLKGLVEEAERLGLWFISDEIYHGLTYDAAAHTALEFSENAIVINSFSKYFSMTGWRVGWMIVPDNLVRAVERLQQNLFISAPTLSQLAAVHAFDVLDDLEAYKEAYRRNRDVLLEGLANAGFTEIAPADGAFYLYADISAFSSNSAEFARKMLDEIGVATTPGLDFDEECGERYLRFSYAGANEEMVEAGRRIKNWLSAS